MVKQDCVIFVEPNQGIRNALSHAIRAEKIVSKAVPYNCISQVLLDLRAGHRADVVFISNHFAHEEVLEFVSAAKNTVAARDAAFVLITDQSKQRAQALARQVLMGMDGFLSFPFNIETVQTTIKIALDVRRQRVVRRIELASKMLLHDFSTRLDHLTYDAAERGGPLTITEEMKQICAITHTLCQEAPEAYFGMLMRAFDEAPPRLRFVGTRTLGAEYGNETHVEQDQIKKILTRLNDKSSFIRVRALLQVEAHANEMVPYIDEIQKLSQNDPELRCRKLAGRVLERMERFMQTSTVTTSDDKRANHPIR